MNCATVSKEEINLLKKLVGTIEDLLAENPTLNRKMGLRKKFLGVLGETLGLIRIYKEFGQSVKYCWYGGKKKDHDLVLIKNNKKVKVQIKASAGEDYAFSITVKGFANSNKVIEELREGKSKDAFAIIENDIDRKSADYWVLVHISNEKKDIHYVLGKEDLKKVVKYDFERYLKDTKKHRQQTRFGIDKNNSIRFILKGQNLSTILKDYLEKTDRIKI